jgi:hypothetical protein
MHAYEAADCDNPRCLQPAGARCIDKRGNLLSPSLTHKSRVEAARQNKAYRASLTALVTAELAEIDSTERDRRIAVVLEGIRFARDIMRTPQQDIDRRLAEMIVDGGFDVVTG